MPSHTSIRRIFLAAFVAAFGSAQAVDFPRLDTDKEITRQVAQLIAEHPDLGTLLTVRTKHGVVYLGGTAFTVFSQSNAQSVAQQVPGVRSIVDLSGISE
jgi:osmotically-inducible protein OsmY